MLSSVSPWRRTPTHAAWEDNLTIPQLHARKWHRKHVSVLQVVTTVTAANATWGWGKRVELGNYRHTLQGTARESYPHTAVNHVGSIAT